MSLDEPLLFSMAICFRHFYFVAWCSLCLELLCKHSKHYIILIGHNIFIAAFVEVQISRCENNNNNHTAHTAHAPTKMFTGVNKILFSGPPTRFFVLDSKLFGFLHFCSMSGLHSSVGQVIN